MSPDTLERLMLDKALGALPPDCEALLTAYLGSRPAQIAVSRDAEDTVGLARIAMAEGSAGPVPTFPVSRLLQTRRRDRIRRVSMSIAAVAASVLLGFGVHALLFPTVPANHPQPQPLLVVQAHSEPQPEGHSDGEGFWSERRLCEQASGIPRPSPKRVIWGSPARVPDLGGAS